MPRTPQNESLIRLSVFRVVQLRDNGSALYGEPRDSWESDLASWSGPVAGIAATPPMKTAPYSSR